MSVLRWTPEMLALYERRRVDPTARIGNVEIVTNIGGGASRENAPRVSRTTAGVAPPPSKFRNVKADGYASKRERDRASALRLMQEAGQIRNLREQVDYELIPPQEGERACHYRADFVYDEFATDGWREVVEDCKGVRTPEYVIKRKLMLWRYNIRIRET